MINYAMNVILPQINGSLKEVCAILLTMHDCFLFRIIHWLNDFIDFFFIFTEEKIVAQSTPCPITGDYTGEVPGASGLCAKVASDCNNPDIMFYSVSSCENRSHVYEGKSNTVPNMS